MGDANLEIEVADDASVEYINPIDPNGELFDQQRLATGETTTSFEILGRYGDSVATGDYELIVLDGDDRSTRRQSRLRQSVRLRMSCGQRRRSRHGRDKNSPVWDEYAAVVIENTGTIPSLLTELRWQGSPVARLLSK